VNSRRSRFRKRGEWPVWQSCNAATDRLANVSRGPSLPRAGVRHLEHAARDLMAAESPLQLSSLGKPLSGLPVFWTRLTSDLRQDW
jgi:hypothetical protein